MPSTGTRLDTAIRSSRTLTTTRSVLVSSFIYSLLTNYYTTFTSLEQSRISLYYQSATTYAYYQAVSHTFGTAISTAYVLRLGAVLVRWTKAAYLYRWLTKEPEPDVIVIDLRDTLSVGPVIALLDYIISRLIPASHRSRLIQTVHHLLSTFKSTPIRYTSILLLIALSTNVVLSFVTGSPSQLGVIIQLILIGVFLAGTQVRLSWPEVIETRPVQLLIAALEPPEPPDWDDNNDPPTE